MFGVFLAEMPILAICLFDLHILIYILKILFKEWIFCKELTV